MKNNKQKEFLDAELAWLGLPNVSDLQVKNPLGVLDTKDPYLLATNYIEVVTNPAYLHGFVKRILGIQLLPIQVCILQELWTRTFPMYIATRGFGKSFMLALYALLRALLTPRSKIVLTGAGFRQAKLIFEYIERFWNESPILRDICNKDSGPSKDADRWYFRINDSIIVAIPLGDGSKIRGLRANIIIADEFNSIRPDIYETVVSGFASVSMTPIDNVQKAAKRKYLKKHGLWTEEQETLYSQQMGNQSIISGTAGFDFEHFADYWKKYKTIITSKGDKRKIAAAYGRNPDEVEDMNWKDFSIIRVPYDLIPEGFMDDKHITRAKATVHSGIFLNEYGACFSKDSEGFFKRSLIESCVAHEKNVKEWKLEYCPEVFNAMIIGDRKKQYVYGIDPASEKDNFSIVICELHKEHARVVYVWTVNRDRLKKMGGSDEDYYAYCTRKIRNLMKIFPCSRLGIDTQGGGRTIIESLHDKNRMEPGELQIWPTIDPDKPKDTDVKSGLHIIEEINFSKFEWTSEANHGLRKDMETKTLLFPNFDGLALSLAVEHDIRNGLDKNLHFDSLESCIEEIEELKNELSTIVMTQSGIVGRDRWDTPEIKGQTGKKERLRKDRYSALLIANMIARTLNRADAPFSFNYIGGKTQDLAGKEKEEKLYSADWYNFTPKAIYHNR
jgi:hypothetical protein